VTSPLIRVQLFEKGMEWSDALGALQQKVNAVRDSLAAELAAMNAHFDAAPPIGAPARPSTLPLERLEQIYRVFSYVARWTGQIQERLVQLAI
jgi:hypothetical protein